MGPGGAHLRTTRMRTKFLEIVEYLLIVDHLEEPGEKYWRNGSRKWHRLASWIGVAQRPIGIPPTQDLRRVYVDVAVTIFDVEFKTSGKRLEKSSNPRSRVLPGLTNHNNASPHVNKVVWRELGSRNLQLQICPANLR